jgi:hypothetical protein
MILTAGCAADQQQGLRKTIDVAHRLVVTTRNAMEAVEQGATWAACIEQDACSRAAAAYEESEYGSIMEILHETLD